MGRKSSKKLIEFVDALVTIGTRQLVADLAIDEEKAQEVARKITQQLCWRFRKTIMYVPVDLEDQLATRDLGIWAQYGQDGPDGVRKYTPLRVAQLAEQYDLTVAHIYCIVRTVHQREIASRQGRLPGMQDDPPPPSR